MLCLFAASHVPALLWVEIPGYAGKEILLISWLVIVVQAGDIAHFVVPAAGRTDPDRADHPPVAQLGRDSWAHSVPGSWSARCWPGSRRSRPGRRRCWQSAVAVLGYAGGMVMASIKRDKGVADWGHLLPGQGGFIDRLDSVLFAAPLFFHLVRFFYEVG